MYESGIIDSSFGGGLDCADGCAMDSFDGTCFRLCAYHFAGFDYFRFPAIYQDITPEEVLAFLARVVKPDRCALSVIDSVAEPAI